MKYVVPFLIIALGFLSAVIPACKPTVEEGDTIVNIPTQPTEEAISLTSQGWTAFEQKNYAQAAALFLQATGKNNIYADAYNGLGWTSARLDSMAKAEHYFDIAASLDFSLIDAFAGRSFVSLALGKYQDAIAAVQRVQDIGPPFYAFRHDPNISLNDLLLVKAQGAFMLADYETAQSLIDRIDPGNHLDASSTTYVEDLALEIENLWGRI